jgi:hypothetical protein
MVLNSVGEEKKEDSPKKESLIDGVVTPAGDDKSKPIIKEEQKSGEQPKPKIDFNVSEEDLAKHKAQKEQERQEDLA